VADAPGGCRELEGGFPNFRETSIVDGRARMKQALMVLVVFCLADGPVSVAQPPATRIHKLEELRWPQIDALDRERTLFILTIGMLEEHGPHLPIGADTFGVAFEAAGVAREVARALPQWNVVMMPVIDYGNGGANVIGGQLVHPGTYGIRRSTLRSLVADIGAQLAENRFKWIFVLTGHGSPSHGVAVNEACDFVSESFGVRMVHVSALFRADEPIQARGRAVMAKHFSPAEITSLGLDPHAGTSETSVILALRPDLVPDSYKRLAPLIAQTPDEMRAIASTPGWPGYLSSPARATPAYGRAVETWWIDGMSDLVLRAVGGQDLSMTPRAPTQINSAVAPMLDKALAEEQAFEAKLQEWLSRRRPPQD
jgi:creatinine amidohydrolase